MPVFKVRPEQPGLPSRSSSVPPMHLHSPSIAHTLPSATYLSSLAEQCTPTKPSKPSKPSVFAWSRLPQHIQQGILAHALLPDGPDTPITIGLPGHRGHLKTTAVPVFLALGSCEAYINALSVFYRHIHLDLSLFPDSAMTFLTSPFTFRPRSLVGRIQLRFTIKENMPLFDTGYTVSQSMGKLIKMNIPTALRSMNTHGRLGEVELLILRGSKVDLDSGSESAVPGYYFPMAKIQLGGCTPEVESDALLQPAEVVVAPAFLACRAFQSGLLPLLEDGAFEKTGLALQSMGGANADMVEDEKNTAAHHVERNAFVQYWLGATVLELLDISLADQTWTDPFPIAAQCSGDADEIMVDLTWRSGSDTVVPSRETRHELVSSPIKYPTSSSGSDTGSSSDEVMINFDALNDGSRQEEESASQKEPELSDDDDDDDDDNDDDDDDDDDDDTSSQDSSSSSEFVHELHKGLGATPWKQGPTDRSEQWNGLASPKDGGSPSSSPSDDSSPSPAAMHLEVARAELITTLTAVVASDDTMEAIARATADRQLTSYGATEGPCKHDGDMVPGCSACLRVSEDSSESTSDDDDIPRTPTRKVPPASSGANFPDLGETMSGPLLTRDSTRLPGVDETDSDNDTDTNSSSSSEDPVDERGHKVSPADLSLIEDVFGARAEDETILDMHGSLLPTSRIMAGMTSGFERAEVRPNEGKRARRVDSVDHGLDNKDEAHPRVGRRASKSVATDPTAKAKAQAGMKPDKTSGPQRTITTTTPAHHASGSKPLTPVSARSKCSAKLKGSQTKGLPNKPAKFSHPQAEQTIIAVAANDNHVSRKRKAPPPPAAAADEPARSTRTNRRKRARAFKEKQLQLAKRIEAEAAEKEKTLVN